MTRLVRASELMGQPVVTLDTAATIGEVRDVLFDAARSRVVALTVRGVGLLSSPLIGLLPTSAIASIELDAVTIATDSSLLRHREGMARALEDQVEVLGKAVVNAAGVDLGRVVDVILEVEAADAVVVGCEIEREEGRVLMPLPSGMPLSSDALVVPAAAEPYVANGLAGFRDALSRSRAASGAARP